MLAHHDWHPTCPLYTFWCPFMFLICIANYEKGKLLQKAISWASSSWTNIPFAITMASTFVYSLTSLLPLLLPPLSAPHIGLSQTSLMECYSPDHILPPMKMSCPESGARKSLEKWQGSWVISLLGYPRGIGVSSSATGTSHKTGKKTLTPQSS